MIQWGVSVILSGINKNDLVELDSGQFDFVGVEKNKNARRSDGQPIGNRFLRSASRGPLFVRVQPN